MEKTCVCVWVCVTNEPVMIYDVTRERHHHVDAAVLTESPKLIRHKAHIHA